MSRSSLGASTLAALEANTATPIYFLELLIDDQSPETTVRIHTGLGQISWDTKTWVGAGTLLSVEGIEETIEINPAPFRCALSGVNSDVTDVIFNYNWHQRPCKFYLGALSDGALIEDPGVLFSGFIQNITMEIGGTDSVLLEAENEFVLFKRSRNVRYTDRQLQSEYSGDLGLEFVDQVASKTVVWRGRANRMGASNAANNIRAAAARR